MPKRADVADRLELSGEAIERARSGDQGAWREIVNALGPTIRGFARAKGVPDPDDVTQEVFLAVAQGLGRFKGGVDAFRSWVFAIAYRRIVDRWRRSGRATFPLDPTAVDPLAPTPEEAVLQSTAASDALAATAVLTDDERDVVLLRVLAGFDTKDVARVIGKRPGNVRVIQTRALAKLRMELERRGYGSGREQSAGVGS